MKRHLFLLALCTLTATAVRTQPAALQTRWTIVGDHAIRWRGDGSRLPHNDHVEMSGEQISARLHYDEESDGHFTLSRTLVWPMLRINSAFQGCKNNFSRVACQDEQRYKKLKNHDSMNNEAKKRGNDLGTETSFNITLFYFF